MAVLEIAPGVLFPKKEGTIKAVASIEQIAQERKVVLLDNNFFSG